MRTSIVISKVFIGILLVSCGTPTEETPPITIPTNTEVPTQPPPPTEISTPTPEPTIAPVVFTGINEIVGNWYREWGGFDLILRIEDDGTVMGTNFAAPATLEFVDGLLHWTTPGTDECPAGTVFIYEISGVPKESIKFKKIDETCDTYLPGRWSSKP
jgi:hypothetical protein